MSHDVFISYSTKDKIIADAVCARLEESKIRVWIAPRDVPAGANFAESIINAIDACKVFVLIWSANTNTSEHILTELNQAFDQGITIIPFRIQDVQPTSAMRYYIGRTHWLDALTLPLEKHIGSLKDTIQMNLGRESQVTTVPALVPPVPQALPGEKDKVPAGKKRSTRTTSRKKLTAVLLAAGGIVLLAIVGLLLSGNFKNLLPANLSQPTSQFLQTPDPVTINPPELNITLSPTVSPTQITVHNYTPTPVPAWVKDVSASIWTYMVQKPPDFYDDFSLDTGQWKFSPAPEAEECNDPSDAVKEVSDGTMKLSIVSCRVANLTHSGFRYANYVLQMDVNYHNNPLGLEFRFNNESPLVEEGDIGLAILPKSWNSFQISKPNNVIVYIPFLMSSDILDPSKPATITIFNQNPQFLIYVNSTLILAYDKLESYQGPFEMDFTVNSWNTTPTEYLMLELDNVRIWDLDELQ